MKVKVKQKNDFLTIESKDRYTDLVIPLVLEEIEEKKRIYTLSVGVRQSVEF